LNAIPSTTGVTEISDSIDQSNNLNEEDIEDEDDEEAQEDEEELAHLQEEARHHIDEQQKNRPLLLQQKKCEQEANRDTKEKTDNSLNSKQINSQSSHKPGVLRDDDTHLQVVLKVLRKVHEQFYQSGTNNTSSVIMSDVRTIISEMKAKILNGVRLAFSSVIPLGADPMR